MLFLLAMLSAGLYGYSRSGHARTLAMNRINAAIPGTLSAGQIRLLAEGALLRLDDIRLMDAKGNFCLAFDSLRLKIQWRSLFDKVLEISLLQIDGLTLNLIEDATGRINLVNALTAGDDMPEDSPETIRPEPACL